MKDERADVSDVDVHEARRKKEEAHRVDEFLLVERAGTESMEDDGSKVAEGKHERVVSSKDHIERRRRAGQLDRTKKRKRGGRKRRAKRPARTNDVNRLSGLNNLCDVN